MKKYLWVSEKIIDGIKYELLRNDEKPTEVMIRVGEEIKPFDIKKWSEFNGN